MPPLCVGTYNRQAAAGSVLYVRVAASAAEHVKAALQRYGFKILAVYQKAMGESDNTGQRGLTLKRDACSES